MRKSAQTLIAGHFGVTNAKWRVHIPLFVHADFFGKLKIHVANQSRDWSENFTIDDSFEHFVHLKRPESNKHKYFFL